METGGPASPSAPPPHPGPTTILRPKRASQTPQRGSHSGSDLWDRRSALSTPVQRLRDQRFRGWCPPPAPGPDAQSWRARRPWEDPRVGLGSVSKAITKAGGHRPATLWPHRGGGCSCAWRYHHNADSSGVLWHLPPAPGEPFLSGGAAANADLSEPGSKGQQAAASLFPSHS